MDQFMYICATVLLISAMVSFKNAKSAPTVFDVMNFGAVGNGAADDTSAFQKAWDSACKAGSGSPEVNIPAGKVFLVRPITFTGPCKTPKISFLVRGQMKASTNPKMKAPEGGFMGWLIFSKVNGLDMGGGGSLDGQGKPWWDVHCRYHPGPGCIMLAPTMLIFDDCSDVDVSNLRFSNSPQTHVLAFGSKNVHFSSVHISSPGDSPNTDGIHIASSTSVSVTQSDIASGDDCVSIGDHTSDINVTSVNCGPGHGVSVGSLGKGGAKVSVADIRVRNVNFTGTTNGGRIKTWQEASGTVSRVEFADLHFSSVENPIIIDQYYCDKPHSCPLTKTGVHIDHVSFARITGTSKTQNAINLNCSNNVPCTNILLDSIAMNPATPVKALTAACNFAHGSAQGTVVPHSCLFR